MQRTGMNVSYSTPPITNRESNKENVKVSGYNREDGLYQRLQAEYKQLVMKSYNEFE